MSVQITLCLKYFCCVETHYIWLYNPFSAYFQVRDDFIESHLIDFVYLGLTSMNRLFNVLMKNTRISWNGNKKLNYKHDQ